MTASLEVGVRRKWSNHVVLSRVRARRIEAASGQGEATSLEEKGRGRVMPSA